MKETNLVKSAQGGDDIAKGIPQERIRKYGFAFCGKTVLIGAAPSEKTVTVQLSAELLH